MLRSFFQSFEEADPDSRVDFEIIMLRVIPELQDDIRICWSSEDPNFRTEKSFKIVDFLVAAWRIIPVSKWLITRVIKSPK